MRKLLELVAFLALATLILITANALLGPNALTGPIPTHFDATGAPTTYGPSRMLLLLPAIGLFLYTLISVISRNPASFNYPVRITPQNRARMQSLALQMITCIKAEVLTLFAAIQYFTIRTARLQQNSLPTLLMPAALILVFLTIALYILAMRQTVQTSPSVPSP